MDLENLQEKLIELMNTGAKYNDFLDTLEMILVVAIGNLYENAPEDLADPFLNSIIKDMKRKHGRKNDS